MSGGAAPRSRAELLQMLDEQRNDYLRALPGKVERLEALWAEAGASPEPGPLLGEMERLAHGLHGTAGTFGLKPLSQAGHSLELAIAPLAAGGALPDGDGRRRIAEAIGAIRSCLPPSKSA